jgi:thioredoxin reductase
VITGDKEYLAKSVIVATGAEHRLLGVPGKKNCPDAAFPTALYATVAFSAAKSWS